MTLHGKIYNGTVVLDGPANVPDGTPVVVIPEPPRTVIQPRELSEEELRRRKAALDEIAALPNENLGDTFSGADHDKILYGEAK